MNNITFVMGIVLTMLILFLSVGAEAVEAAEMADVTLQVLESNNPADIVNDIELPDVLEHSRRDEVHSASNDSTEELKEQLREVHDEIEDEIEDAEDDIDDSLDDAEGEHE